MPFRGVQEDLVAGEMSIGTRPERRTGATTARVVIADDHELARAGIKTLLEGERGLEVVGSATNGREAVRLCQELHPDLILLDLRMPELDGLAATRLVKDADPRIVVIVMTMYEDPHYLFEAINVGAAGYLLKDASRSDVLDAIRRALRGETLLGSGVVPHLARRVTTRREHASPNGARLTARERAVLEMVARGKSNREIAEKFVVTEGTVKVHISKIFSKLNVSDRTQAVVRAISLGMVSFVAD